MKSIVNGNEEKSCLPSVSNWFSVILVDPNFFCLPVRLSDRSLHRKSVKLLGGNVILK